jgi:hypothetical protein
VQRIMGGNVVFDGQRRKNSGMCCGKKNHEWRARGKEAGSARGNETAPKTRAATYRSLYTTFLRGGNIDERIACAVGTRADI